MSRIDELMAAGLPSKKNEVIREGADCPECGTTTPMRDECGNMTPVNKEDSDDDDELEAEFDDITDEELAELSDEDLEGISEDELAALDGDDEEELTDDEADVADETMALAATPIILKDELTSETAFESFGNEFTDMVNEGFLFESDADDFFIPESEVFTEKRVFAAKTKVMLDEKDRRKQLFEVGVQASARAHNDPIYWKLQKVYKLERLYKAKLRQKYRGESLRRVKAYIKKLRSSKSKILSSLANKLDFNKK